MTQPLKVTAALVKNLYPYPTLTEYRKPERYCVGGAFIKLTGFPCEDGFPDEYELRDALELYSGLDADEALRFAQDIIEANDNGRFNDAYDLLSAAIG